MIDYDTILEKPPFNMAAPEKNQFLLEIFKELSKHHYESCAEYKRILNSKAISIESFSHIEDIPFLPVRMFKHFDLMSVPRTEIIKTMTSSGTSGQDVSKIFLDRNTSRLQTKTLTKIVSSFLGSSRYPMIIIDKPSVVRDRGSFSARGAGILGFSIFARDKIYALDDDMNLDIDGIRAFLEKHSGERIFLFGFTYIIWLHFYKKLKQHGINVDLSRAVLMHGGGWKKLSAEAVSTETFNQLLRTATGLTQIYEYYGMVEQTGTIYIGCEYGHLHSTVFSDIIIRRGKDFSVAPHGEQGLIQLLSTLPVSYPGHSILTEDIGVIIGEDDCRCGRKGKYFRILGRVRNAELRGCSDTYEPV